MDADRLRNFFKMLLNKRRYSFEFRDPSWYAPRILKMLTEQNISLCLSDHHDAPTPWKRTADFVYIRAHGPGGRYKGHYPQTTLTEWANESGPGKSAAATSTSILTTTRNARHPLML
jgi:uncharacterized protein YecE (DUF72 family)